MKNYYNYDKEKVLSEFETDLKGISVAEAKKRLEKYGANEIQEGEKKSVLKIFLEQYTDFLVIILILAGIVSAFLGDVESALVIFVVITMNAILGTVQQVKADKSLESLKALSSPVAKVIRDGEKISINSKDVVVGDIVLAEAGDYICADGRIIENYNIKVDESSLTGESISVEKDDTTIEGEVPVGDRKNMVFSGSFVTYGRAEFVVTGTGMDTELGKVAKLLKDTKTKKTPLQQNLDNFGKKLSMIIIVICAILFAVSIFRGDEVIDAFMFAVALAVAAIPEALSSIVTIVLSFGTQKMAKENAIVRKLHAVEGLGSVSIICSDKTGTLTQNKMTVKKYSVNNTVVNEGEADFSKVTDREILYMSILCNDAENKDGNEIGDPTEVALINFGNKYGYDYNDVRSKYPRISEIAFDSDRKLMSTLNVVDGKNTMITKGAVDVLMNRVKYIEKNGEILDITDEDKNKVSEINESFSRNGLRVLAFAKKYTDSKEIGLDDENDMIFVGLISMMDPPREESRDAVLECIGAGIRPVMITGDHKVTASAIAKEIGILKNDSEAVDGAEIDSMTDEELQNYVDKISVYARVSPEHKIRIVRAWQNRGNIVAMTGDGVNDAPALKQADIGVAMGITGSEVAKDSADVVLADDNFATIVKAVENGRNLYINIKNSIKFLLSGNTAGILAVLYASLMGLSVPFAPVHLLFINLLTDSLPAIALGVEPHSKSVMNDKPRPINESILTKDFIIDVIREGIVICIGTMVSYYIGLNAGGSGLAMTMAFSTLCLSRLIHGFNCKSKEPVIFTKKMFNNIYIWGAFFIGFILLNLVLLVPVLFDLFEITPLTTNLLFTIYGVSLLTFVANQIIKFIICKVK
ncbi:MAG: cation-translocating P-type ATPase [Tyzzerella sp.]|uniref:P-type Ca(2+) transporter n=1 Tax=Candidatus Fimicola merdigallinarum TaxID=2840819 RepID=A0A9D9DVE5_9FIRM|nr:cation-translocating P-type ATPase [Candidatus Fimicola merdigallinarum]